MEPGTVARAAGRLVLSPWAPALAFFLAGAWRIDFPGFYADELLASDAVFPHPPGGPFYSIEIAGFTVPLMLMPYLGALKGWLWAPAVWALGPGAASWRLPALALGALTIVLLHRFLSHEGDRATAAISAWLVAVDPTFYWTTRHDWGPAVLQRLLCVAFVAAGYAWLRGGSRRWLFAAGAAAGLGVFDKLTFHWLILAGVLAAVASDGARWKSRFSLPAAGLLVAGFLAGAAPYLLYRIAAPPSPLALEIESEPQRYAEKFWMLEATLEGRVASGFLFAAERPAVGGITPEALVVGCLLLPWTWGTRLRPVIVFAAVLTVAAWAQMVPLRDAGSIHHLAIVYPWPLVFLGATVAAAARRLSGVGAKVWIAGACGALLVSSAASTALQFRDGLRDGAALQWSEAVYDLAEEIRRIGPSDVVLLEWNASHSLRFLLANEPPVWNMLFESDWAPENPAVPFLLKRVADENPVFVAYAREADRPFPEAVEACRRTLSGAGVELVETVRIPDRRGRPVFTVLRAVDSGSGAPLSFPR